MIDDGYFDKRVASTYDDDAEMFASEVVDPVIDFLVEKVGEGNALEFGIGTGRIALPLTERGVAVHGIDLSKAMVGVLKNKTGGPGIDVTIGDFARASVAGSFSVVYLVFNTIMNLTTQAAQVACFANAAAHLEPGGCFVIETMIPQLRRLTPGESLVAFDVRENHWGIDEYDVVTQGLVSHHLQINGSKLKRNSTPFRYVWPAELDLMAQLAGLTLSERWGGWRGEAFTSTSKSHVSVWKKNKG